LFVGLPTVNVHNSSARAQCREGPQLAQFRRIEAIGGEPGSLPISARMPNCSEPCGGPPIERFWLRELLVLLSQKAAFEGV